MSLFNTKELSPDEKLIVRRAFFILNLQPTIDKQLISSAFRKKSFELHPDKAKDDTEAQIFHYKFIELTQARDICLKAILIPNIINQLKNVSPFGFDHDFNSFNIYLNPTLNYEEEWKLFVNHKNAYQNLFSGTGNFIFTSIVLFLIISASSIAVLVIFGIISMIIGVSIGGTTLIPIAGFIIARYLVPAIIASFREWFPEIKEYIILTASKTGFPYKVLIINWVFVNLIFLYLLFKDFNYTNSNYFLWALVLIPLVYLQSWSINKIVDNKSNKDIGTSSAFLILTSIVFIIYFVILAIETDRNSSLNDWFALISIYFININYITIFLSVKNMAKEIENKLTILRKTIKMNALPK